MMTRGTVRGSFFAYHVDIRLELWYERVRLTRVNWIYFLLKQEVEDDPYSISG